MIVLLWPPFPVPVPAGRSPHVGSLTSKLGANYNLIGLLIFRNGRLGRPFASPFLSRTVPGHHQGFGSLIWYPGTPPPPRSLFFLLMMSLTGLVLRVGFGRLLPHCGMDPPPSLSQSSSWLFRPHPLHLVGAVAAPCMHTFRSLASCSSLSPPRWLAGSSTSARAFMPHSTGALGGSPRLVVLLRTFGLVSTIALVPHGTRRHITSSSSMPCPWVVVLATFAMLPQSRHFVTFVLAKSRPCGTLCFPVRWHNVFGRTSALFFPFLMQSPFSRLLSPGLPKRRS